METPQARTRSPVVRAASDRLPVSFSERTPAFGDDPRPALSTFSSTSFDIGNQSCAPRGFGTSVHRV